MENTPQQQEEGKHIIRVLACVLNKLIEANQNAPNLGSREITKFHALEPPNISVLDYLERIHKYACCSNECFILSLIYIDRLIQMNNFALTGLNVHRVIITRSANIYIPFSFFFFLCASKYAPVFIFPDERSPLHIFLFKRPV
mmetsp:Transcript_13301/g.22184  ORF Transcript_13301/g.22184 Transcript_13301/m.22184 type:complete len:143 (-) Transcript_13301:1465-1893(-)